ncbi:MAG: leucine-rich repeat domain-containing protein [Paludibacteraceae bacterium]|nr:leucine-rich repeat domain-containing protein [Paludibacteraceae bacterium]
MKTKLFSLLCALMCAGNLFAYDFYVNGIYYNKLGGNSVEVTYQTTNYNSYSGSVTIPETVTYSNTTYRVTKIGRSAFDNCSGLTSVTIPSSVTTIGEHAFLGCTKLTSVTIPNSVTTIGDYAFDYCTGLTSITIPNSLTKICEGAFGSCTSLVSVEIPNTITTIESRTFAGCSGLTSITIPSSVTTIGDYAFSGCTKLTSVTIPNSVTTIGNYAFNGCTKMTSVEIPNSVTTIGDCAFYECSGLTSVTIPSSVTTIGESAFEDCVKLTSVTIGKSVTTIGQHAFEDCSSLTSITIPNSVTTIGWRAFYGCSGLNSVTIGNSVQTIGSEAFSGCTSLTFVTLNSNALCSEAYTSSSNFKSVFGSQVEEYCIGNAVTVIGKYAFSGCSGLNAVTIPNSVNTIGSSAFNNCTNLKKIVCEIEKPLAITSDVFSSYDAILYVPAKGVNRYKLADGWKNFKMILPIQAEEVVVTEIQVEPSENFVSIAWRAVENAYNYVIVIKQSEDTICKLTFNAEGQLMSSLYYAPQRGLQTSSASAEQITKGWHYIIRDLEEATEYAYSIVAYDENGTILESQVGSFRTLSASGLENMEIKTLPQKYIKNNQLHIFRNGKMYNALGGVMR